MSPVTDYLDAIKRLLDTGRTTEHSHRPALAELFEALGPEIQAINEPKRIACGAPDLAILHAGLLVGHVEAKDVGAALNQVERSEQVQRYRSALSNLILTDYLEFRWYVDGDLRRTATLGRWDGSRFKADRAGVQNVAALLGDFLAHTPQPIATPRELAERMARLAHLIREVIVTAFETGRASDLLLGWRKAFAEVLIADLEQPEKVGEFADMFAQTLVYGLFSARVMQSNGRPFDRREAQNLIPRTNPFLRKFFYQITGPDLDDEPYAGFVNDLVQLLAQADMEAILADFGKRTRQEDPTVHFYETFLAAYDPRLREARGVYYTPAPVVSFIVRSVDELLKSKFGLPQGLADTSKVTVKNTDPGLRVRGKETQIRKTTQVHKVLILDPATGTGTFPYAVVDFIREQFMHQGNAGMWSGYVREHLLPRIFGFELLMAPYAVAHFKLAMQLAAHDLPEAQQKRWAYDFASDERIGIYLTNALEGPHEHAGLPLFTQFLADESAAADEIKRDLPIMVVLGNPPYSGHSANQNPWIDDLLHGKLADGEKVTSYYEVDGEPLGERNTKWLQDDYVKFIRLGQWRIEQSGGGILAYISNNGYLDNPTFRGMRQSLMETFTEIYLLDLHGNARKKEVAPDGTPDENVFAIMQGVAIGIFVKDPGKTGPAKVYHADLWGKREDKYKELWDSTTTTVEWTVLQPQKPFYLLIPQNVNLLKEYQEEWKLTDIMPVNVLGFQTHRDHFAVAFNREEIAQRIKDMRNTQISTDRLRQRYRLRDNRDWQLNNVRTDVQSITDWEQYIIECAYRVFDKRYCYFDEIAMDYPRRELKDHVAWKENISLLASRQQATPGFRHSWIAREPANDCVVSTKSHEANQVFPLYLYPEDDAATLFDTAAMSPWPPDPEHGDRVPNLAPEFVAELAEKLGLTFEPHKDNNTPGERFGPQDILAYIYAIFHSPTYRERYAEFLKIDFPRVPLTSDPELFWELVGLGRELIALHLLEAPQVMHPITHYPIPGDNEIPSRGGYPKYTPPNPDQEIGGRVYINKDQYFEGVPEEIWAFEVGGLPGPPQVAQRSPGAAPRLRRPHPLPAHRRRPRRDAAGDGRNRCGDRGVAGGVG